MDSSGRVVFETAEEFDQYCRSLAEQTGYRFGDWIYEPFTRTAGGVFLTPIETHLLGILIAAAGERISAKEIDRRHEAAFGYPIGHDSVRTHIAHLRAKVGLQRLPLARYHNGYRFVAFPTGS